MNTNDHAFSYLAYFHLIVIYYCCIFSFQNLRCESKENSLLKLVLDVLGHLVRYGYYDDIEDVDELLGPLTELLNGETDLPSERKSKKGRIYDIFKCCI